MDVTSSMDASCREYIYSDDYLGYFVKYDNDLQGLREVMAPECVDIVNSRFLVAYKKAPSIDDLESFFAYGYANLPKVYGLMDVPAVEDIGAYAVRNLPGLGLEGEDVLIGFIDTGIDYRGTVFLDGQGRSRIRYIWDQGEDVYGAGPPVFGYGAEFTNEDINRANASDNPYAVVPSRDEVGHGTFLASIAAGAEDLEENFSGVAPNAQIIMVKLKQASRTLRDFYYVGQDKNCYSEVDIAQGIRYLINKAVQLGKPMVICVGLGSNQGGHDGSSNLELYIEALSGLRGICFVAPAGNELGARKHYMGADALAGQNIEINVEAGVSGFAMELWGNAPGLLRIIIVSPSGERLDSVIPNITGATTGDFLFEGSSVFVENVVVESTTGDQVIFIRFDYPAQGIWSIQVLETENQLGGGFNAWLPIDDFIGDSVTFVNGSPEITITSPGNSRGCITAAAYNNVSGGIYVESSRGFTRKGSVKPDITAPGVGLKGVFATSRDGALYIERSGSSVAAAILAGGAALLLQWGIVKRNNLGVNTEIIKQMFIRGANRDSELVYPNTIWGWGTLNLLQIFQNMRQ